MQQQTIQDIETQANQLLEGVYQRKSDTITSYSKLKRQEEALDIGFASVGFPDESMDSESVYEILQPGFIFEVIVSKKNIAKGRLDVILQKFLAFSDKCITSQHQVRQADFSQFKKQKHLLSQLTQINVMRIKGVIYEQDVIEDFSIFTYYINYEKIQVGDHLNAVLIDKTKMTMSLKNKSIMGGKQWSLKSLQNPSHFDNWLHFRLGYAKQIGVNFQYQVMSEEEKQKAQDQINENLKFKEETGTLKMDYQIEQDGFFPNKQNYAFMMQSLGLSQNTSFTNRNNLKPFMKINLDHRRRLYQIIYFFQTFKSICLTRCPIDICSQVEESKQQLKKNNKIIKNIIHIFKLIFFYQFIFLPKFQNSFALDKNLQTLIESFSIYLIKPQEIILDIPIRSPGTQTLSNLIHNPKRYNPIPTINSTLLNDEQDIIFKFSPNNKNLLIITLDRLPLRDQKDDELPLNPYLSPNYSYQQLMENSSTMKNFSIIFYSFGKYIQILLNHLLMK